MYLRYVSKNSHVCGLKISMLCMYVFRFANIRAVTSGMRGCFGMGMHAAGV